MGRSTPALLMRTWMRPKFPRALETMRATSALDVTSPGAARASAPDSRRAHAVRSGGINVEVVHDEFRTACRKPSGDGPTHAPPCAGHDGDPAGEVQCHGAALAG